MASREDILTTPGLEVFFDICPTNNEVVPNHWHEHLEILYLLEGSMEIKCNDKTYWLKKEEMFVINSGDIHYTHSATQTVVLLLQIPYEFLNHGIPKFEEVVFSEYFPWDKMETQSLKKARGNLLRMKQLFEIKEDGYPFLFHSNLNELLYVLYREHAEREMHPVDKNDKGINRLKEIITYVEEHYREPISLSDVAEQFALNPEYFCRYFKKNVGFTFLEYVNMVRLPRIYEELISTKDSISKIQERHGFTNDKVFHRMFKKVYGCTPTEARKREK